MKFGNTTIGGMSFGSTKIGGAKYGNTLVFNGGGSGPTPPEPPTPGAVVYYDYLVFDGVAYVDVSLNIPTGFSIAVMLGDETRKAEQRVFIGSGASSANFGLNYNANTSAATRKMNVYYGKSSAVITGQSYSFSNTIFGFFLTPNRMGINGTAYSITKGNYAPTGNITLGSNVSHSGYPYTGKMGTFKIFGTDAQDVTTFSGFDSYTPVFTLRPCTYNGTPGMYCVETETFFGNSASAGSLSVINSE